jgi:hypothetical protein
LCCSNYELFVREEKKRPRGRGRSFGRDGDSRHDRR